MGILSHLTIVLWLMIPFEILEESLGVSFFLKPDATLAG